MAFYVKMLRHSFTMVKGQVEEARLKGFIKKILVARLFSKPGQTESVPSLNDYVRESNYRYLVLFVPDKKKRPPNEQLPEHWFLLLNRAGKYRPRKDKMKSPIRWYSSLFTVSQDVSGWGFTSFEYLNLARKEIAYLGDAFDELKPYLARSGISMRPVMGFLEELARVEHGVCAPDNLFRQVSKKL